MKYEVSTGRKSIVYEVSTLHKEARAIGFENDPIIYEVNRTPVNVTINQNGDPLLEQRVTTMEQAAGDMDYNFEQQIDTNLTF